MKQAKVTHLHKRQVYFVAHNNVLLLRKNLKHKKIGRRQKWSNENSTKISIEEHMTDEEEITAVHYKLKP